MNRMVILYVAAVASSLAYGICSLCTIAWISKVNRILRKERDELMERLNSQRERDLFDNSFWMAKASDCERRFAEESAKKVQRTWRSRRNS